VAVPVQQSAFTIGEVSPALFGRFDLARNHLGASTFRNAFVSYRGGFYSRAGTAFVGFSKQTGRAYPPRLIPFQFNINQGLALEFGNLYMRVVLNGAFVTESPFAITGVTNANPAVVSFQALSTGVSATSNNGAVTSSYARGDFITLAGGTPVSPSQIQIVTTSLVNLGLLAAGLGYAINDRITLQGGISAPPPVLTVTAIGSGGAITTFAISSSGSFTSNGPGTFTQTSTTGIGAGATFQNGIFGPHTMTFTVVGGYLAVPSNPANQSSTTGAGAGAAYNVVWATPGALVNGDWVQIADVEGMTQINGQTYVISALGPATFQINDVYGNAINSTAFGAWTAGGSASRIYTLSTSYAEADLSYLKFTESADDMSICCVNQQTRTEYPALDLSRLADDNWIFTDVVAAPSVAPPPSITGAASASGSVDYNYVVTAIDPNNGTESIASLIADIPSAVDIASTAGSITITWAISPTPGVNQYNIYKATPAYLSAVPTGSQFGYAGMAFGTQFVDSNIVADFTQVPPTHQNPFAPGPITAVTVTNGGSGSSFTWTITSSTGSGAVLAPVVVSSVLVAVLVLDEGQNYLPTDTVTFNNSAVGTLTIGPEVGTYPGAVAYYQERRGYASTLNQPDTYFFSQPGAFTNFDSRIPTIGSDAIIGAPWSVQVNGIQFMIPMPGGLVVLTGLSAWQLTGTGGSSLNPQPLEPATQQAQPQAYNGCSATIPPIKIDYDILYVQAKGSIVRDLAYQFYTNIYTGTDITLNSSHLFTGFTLKEWAWCEEPYKVMWAVRNDGTLLSLTYLKPQEVAGWGRSDTNGFFESVCSVTEPPVDALYVATQRFPGANTAYMIERMDNRIWGQVEDSWCVDCGLSLPQPEPAANLTMSSAYGLGACSGVTVLVGGANWSAGTTATVVDAPMQPESPGGPGAGAVPVLTIVAGVITAISFAPAGTGYLNPMLVFNDPSNTGSGASATITLDNSATFSADAAVFAIGNIGSVIRAGGGIAVITAYTDNQHVTANILSPIAQKIPNSGGVPRKQPSGFWTMTAPVITITGLNYLAGSTVTGLADGNVVPPTVVAANGTINLGTAASAVTIGLGFRAQLQSLYLDAGEPTVQGARKKVAAVTARIECSRGLKIGSNQPDGSTQSPVEVDVAWGNLTTVPDDGPNFPLKPYNALATPLRTGDIRIPLGGGFATPGQVCIQQDYPLPMQILSLVSEDLPGDTPQLKAPQRQERAKQ
jgi:hypothetical protein